MSLKSIANSLISARNNNSLLNDKLPINNYKEAYDVLKEIINNNNNNFGKQIGWKIGATNEKAQQSLKTNEPFYGPLYEKYLYTNNNNNNNINLNQFGIFRAIEGEFCIKLKNDIIKKDIPYTPIDIYNNYIEGIYPSIEIAATRLNINNLDIYNIIADFALNGCIIMNDNNNLLRKNNDYNYLSDIPVSISINEKQIVSSTGANVLKNPMNALTWLVNKLNNDNIILKKNDIILTGAACLINDVNILKNNSKVTITFDDNKSIDMSYIIN